MRYLKIQWRISCVILGKFSTFRPIGVSRLLMVDRSLSLDRYESSKRITAVTALSSTISGVLRAETTDAVRKKNQAVPDFFPTASVVSPLGTPQ